MKVAKIGHASIVVTAGDVCCFMDPVLTDTFECGANAFDPPIDVDTAACRERCNLLVISHAHMDHFSVRSLAVFDRKIPVLYPAGDTMVAHALERLGFARATPVAPGDRVDVGAMRLVPSQSKVTFPEMGMAFEADGRVFWNLVDTVVDDEVISSMRTVVGRPDLLFAKFQPLVEHELKTNALGSDFPFERYGQLLRNVWTIAPRYVAPASCGYRYTRAAWLNERGFPITERQFEDDLRSVDPQVRVLHVPSGAELEVTDPMRVVPDRLSFVRRRGTAAMASFDWRPDRGVPALRDDNPRGHRLDAMRRETRAFLDGELLSKLDAADPVWSERMARLGVVWRLEVIYPDATVDTRYLDFGARPLAWGDGGASFVKLHTSVTASAIVGLLRGECNVYSIGFNEMRVASRLYAVHRGGVTADGGANDEPLGRVLFEGADERYVDAELRNVVGAHMS